MSPNSGTTSSCYRPTCTYKHINTSEVTWSLTSSTKCVFIIESCSGVCEVLFGHIIRSDSNEDHTRALNAGTDDPPHGRLHQTWLCTIENDLKQQNLGPWSIWSYIISYRSCAELMTVNSGVELWKQRRPCKVAGARYMMMMIIVS